MSAPFLIAVMGTTASGKTELAERLADHLDAQLINADAFQVYRGLDIGTAKSPRKSDYELIDIKDPQESFGLGEWLQMAAVVLGRLWLEKRHTIVVGGTGLYIRAQFEGYAEIYPPPERDLREELMRREEEEGVAALAAELTRRDPELASRVDLQNPIRVRRALERVHGEPGAVMPIPPFQKVKFGLVPTTDVVRQRIEQRVETMFDQGWREEVAALRSAGVTPDDPAMRAHGYRAIYNALEPDGDWNEVKAGIVQEVRHYAKRQRTWLRKEPNLHVLRSWDNIDAAFEEAQNVLKGGDHGPN